MILKFVLYFLLGGLIVTFGAYFGAKGRGFWAAFITLLPSITILTFIFSYSGGGISAAQNYAKGLITVIPAWILYALVMIYLLPKTNIYLSLLAGMFIFISASLILKFFYS